MFIILFSVSIHRRMCFIVSVGLIAADVVGEVAALGAAGSYGVANILLKKSYPVRTE